MQEVPTFSIWSTPTFCQWSHSELSFGAVWVMRIFQSFNVTIWVIQLGLPRAAQSEFRLMTFRSSLLNGVCRQGFKAGMAFRNSGASIHRPVMWLHKLWMPTFSKLTKSSSWHTIYNHVSCMSLSYTTVPHYPAYQALQNNIHNIHTAL